MCVCMFVCVCGCIRWLEGPETSTRDADDLSICERAATVILQTPHIYKHTHYTHIHTHIHKRTDIHTRTHTCILRLCMYLEERKHLVFLTPSFTASSSHPLPLSLPPSPSPSLSAIRPVPPTDSAAGAGDQDVAGGVHLVRLVKETRPVHGRSQHHRNHGEAKRKAHCGDDVCAKEKEGEEEGGEGVGGGGEEGRGKTGLG